MPQHTVRGSWIFGALLFSAAAAYIGCGGSTSSSGGPDAAGAATDGGAIGSSGFGAGASSGAGAKPGTDCRPGAESCTVGSDCCSGLCDPNAGCISTTTHCSAADAPCNSPTDCCSLSCVDGACSTTTCVSDKQACTSDGECCGGVCGADKLCTPLNESCSTAGNECAENTDCCSGLCDDSKHCKLSASFCVQPGDVCSGDLECCTGNCTIADGQSVGTCAAPPKGPSYCDKVDGMLCNGCGDCCSRLCAPGPEGIDICQPASGCHVTGDLCKKDTDCCGGDPNSGLPGAGNGKCQLDPSGKIGLCINPSNGGGGACNPEGNVCHYLADETYTCSSSSARADCCGDETPKWKMCKLDTLGVPRCMGLGECKKDGESCAQSADCCDSRPCVPDATGALHCSAKECVSGGGSCTINADCCPGGLCNRAPGSTVGSCTAIPTDGSGGSGGGPGSGGAGGSGGGSYCSLYGQLCQADGDCCSGVPCTNGICEYVVK